MTDQAAIKEMRSKLPTVLLTLAITLILALFAYQLWLSYRDQIRAAENNTRNLVEIFEARLGGTLRRVDADLQALALEIPPLATQQPYVSRYVAGLQSNLDSRLFNVQDMVGYRIHDAHGELLYSSLPDRMQRENIANSEYFRQLRDETESGLVFSDVLVDPRTGQHTLAIARALRNPQGAFLGVVLGLVDLEYYSNQFHTLNLGRAGLVALRRSDTHAQVIRWPDSPGGMNSRLAPDHPVAQRMSSGDKAATLHYLVPPENVPLILSIQSVPNYPFYFGVGVGRDEVLAGWYSQVTVVSISTLVLFILLGWMRRRMRRMRFREAGILGDLAQSKAQFRELSQMVPVGVCYLDANGCITYANERCQVYLGRDREALLGHNWTDFVHPADQGQIWQAWRHRSQTNSAFASEYRIVAVDGQIMHVFGEIQTERDQDGEVLGYIAALTDISLRQQAEAELLAAKQLAENANMTKTRFLAAASHDLRQPIQAINLFRDALARTELNQEQQTIAGFLSKSVHALGDLLYELLDISKLDAGMVKADMQAEPVEKIFAAIDEEFSTLSRHKNLRFKLFYPFKDMYVLTDVGLLQSVLRNLIDNAFKYTKEGGVLVGVRRSKGRALIQVWDTGIGIDPYYGDQIFEECFQIGNTMRDRTKGLGIGLSIARRMAVLFGGQVTYRSRPGRGTVFNISLPLADEQAIAKAMIPSVMATEDDDLVWDDDDFSRVSGWRVVQIEDDPMVAKSVELSLQTIGINVQVYNNAEMALAQPDILGADFYLSDFNLPGMNGVEFLDALTQLSPTPIRAALMTGETAPKRIELMSASRWTVLYKPVSLPRLIEVMRLKASVLP